MLRDSHHEIGFKSLTYNTSAQATVHTRFYKYVPTIRINQARAPTCTPSPQATCKQQQAITKRDKRRMPSRKRIEERAGRMPYRIDTRRDAVSRRIYEQYLPSLIDARRDERCTPSQIATQQKRRAMYAVSRVRTGRAMNAVSPNVMTIRKGTRDERRPANRKETSDGRRLGISENAVPKNKRDTCDERRFLKRAMNAVTQW